MAHTATRLITLIMLLQREPNQKAADLAEELGVSVRSLHRYIKMLEDMGIPLYAERGPQGGFSLARGYRMPPLVFTPQEATAVYLGTSLVSEMWGRLYAAAAQGAMAKLDNVLPDEQRHEIAWARRSLFALGLHRADHEALAPMLEKLRLAIYERRQVTLVYRGSYRRQTLERKLDPYALIHRWGWWYTIGYCHLRGAVRTFRLDRIHELTLLDHMFDQPESFDPQAYLAQEIAPPQLTIRLRFLPAFAFLARENSSLWESLNEKGDGAVEVTFAAPDPEWGVSMVLSFSGAAVVMEPAEVRTAVRERAKLIVAGHLSEE